MSVHKIFLALRLNDKIFRKIPSVPHKTAMGLDNVIKICEVFYGHLMYIFHEFFDFSRGYFEISRASSDCLCMALVPLF